MNPTRALFNVLMKVRVRSDGLLPDGTALRIQLPMDCVFARQVTDVNSAKGDYARSL
jgi:hypothetical protein